MPKNKNLNNQLRIIGGKWRGSKITFPDLKDLRPTSDRMRETLFNWLTPNISDSRCLDVFAGSGTLGLEALSRGAAQVDFIDSNRAAVQSIQTHLQRFDCDKGQCHHLRVPTPEFTQAPYDIIFLDPPFAADLVAPTGEWLAEFCHEKTLIFLEVPKQSCPPPVPKSWRLLKEQRNRAVCYFLFSSK